MAGAAYGAARVPTSVVSPGWLTDHVRRWPRGSVHRAGSGARLVRRPARSLGLLHETLEHLALRGQHILDGLASQHDALEGIHVDLVELAALGPEPDRQERGQGVLGAAGRANGAGEQLDLGRQRGRQLYLDDRKKAD